MKNKSYMSNTYILYTNDDFKMTQTFESAIINLN